MKQRAVIAMSLALHPSLVIADEPVTALDVIVQEQVLKTIRDLQERLSISVIMITHDMSVVAQTCQDVVVMYAGKVVESGPVATIFKRPVHPYTIGLERAFPNLREPKALVSIEGSLPSLIHPPVGCRFAPRCPFALDICRKEEPPSEAIESGHMVACHRMHEADRDESSSSGCENMAEHSRVSPAVAPVVELRDVKKYYALRGGALSSFLGGSERMLHAVDGISLQVRQGEALGLAGESGCGKTTTGKLLLRLVRPTAGQVLFNGQDVSSLSGAPLTAFRRQAQLVFQNPYEALNPRFTIERAIMEPLIIHKLNGRRATGRERVVQALESVNLTPAGDVPEQVSAPDERRAVAARRAGAGDGAEPVLRRRR